MKFKENDLLLHKPTKCVVKFKSYMQDGGIAILTPTAGNSDGWSDNGDWVWEEDCSLFDPNGMIKLVEKLVNIVEDENYSVSNWDNLVDFFTETINKEKNLYMLWQKEKEKVEIAADALDFIARSNTDIPGPIAINTLNKIKEK